MIRGKENVVYFDGKNGLIEEIGSKLQISVDQRKGQFHNQPNTGFMTL